MKNLLLTPEKTMTRKLKEQFMAVIAERRLSKDQILELYLNEVYLGNRGSFAVHGLPEAARLYFGKDVLNLSLAEAATLAGMIQSPQALSPFRSPERCVERRNVVLSVMAETGVVHPAEAEKASQRAAARLRPRARVRGAVLRRLRRTGADQPRASTSAARRPTSTRRWTCTCSAWRRKPCAPA